MREQWRPVSGYVGWYEVSDQGRVRRVRCAHNSWFGRVLRPGINGGGYLNVVLCRDGLMRSLLVSRFVAAAFLGVAPEVGYEVNHKNGDKLDNAVSNLEWVTPQENVRHAVRTGLRKALAGEQHPMALLSAGAVREIRAAPSRRGVNIELARRFGVCVGQIAHIRCGRAWAIVA